MSPNQTLILRRLEQGPAGTADLRRILNTPQASTHKTLQRLASAGLVKNIGEPWKARWELVKQGAA